MWDKVIFGRDLYHVVLWFLTYSILGWIVESIYMSICNKKVDKPGIFKRTVLPDLWSGGSDSIFCTESLQSQQSAAFLSGSHTGYNNRMGDSQDYGADIR